jgi:transcriptional regulator with XRE-family HTH domain
VVTIAIIAPLFCLCMAKQVNSGNDDIQKLAKRIKKLRISKGYSNYEYFAFEKNIPRSQYGRYEKGEDLRFSSLIKLIRAFGMTPEQFFSEGFEDN